MVQIEKSTPHFYHGPILHRLATIDNAEDRERERAIGVAAYAIASAA